MKHEDSFTLYEVFSCYDYVVIVCAHCRLGPQ
jgi:hypothetical protein